LQSGNIVADSDRLEID